MNVSLTITIVKYFQQIEIFAIFSHFDSQPQVTSALKHGIRAQRSIQTCKSEVMPVFLPPKIFCFCDRTRLHFFSVEKRCHLSHRVSHPQISDFPVNQCLDLETCSNQVPLKKKKVIYFWQDILQVVVCSFMRRHIISGQWLR